MPSLKLFYDEIEERKGEDELKEFVRRMIDAKKELGEFVAARREEGGTPEWAGFKGGSYNLSFRYKFSNGGPDALIRIPKPGYIATNLRDEKVANEVEVMEFLRQNTTIPIPRIHCWGTTAESPRHVGPFIIMDFVEGKPLSMILKQPSEKDDEMGVLDPNIEDSTLKTVYRQIASYLLQLSRLTFNKIGAIAKDPTGWSVTKRPLTMNMMEFATVVTYPQDRFPTSAFDHARDYFNFLAQEHLTHLWSQRNIAQDPEIARARFIARHRFAQLVSKYCNHESEPFLLYCDDLRPSNMLADPETLEITAVIDWEFTNVMPAQLAYDPPWWLLLSGPEKWLDRDAFKELLELYEPRVEQFVQALEEVEDEEDLDDQRPSITRLSARMRDSWRSGQFWFDFAAKHSWDVDTVYWAALHEQKGSDGLEMLDDKAREEMEPFVKHKMEQLKLYDEECTARFSKASE